MPFYQNLTENEFALRIEKAYKKLESCDLCPRKCNVNRRANKTGFCNADERIKISSIFPHHGEEPAISGKNGSGTIFFSHCTLRCLFCQNYQISHQGAGEYMSTEQMAEEMLSLQKSKCHNINLVTPTHFVPQIIHALSIAVKKGLSIPIVYNTSGYESVDTLKLLDSIVDIYLPDIKYANDANAKELSNCTNYISENRSALKEMWRQVGPLVTDNNDIAVQGMIIRHLVLPENKASTDESMKWIVNEIGKDVAVSLMAQYSPLHRANEIKEINRRILKEEYFSAVESLNHAGLSEGWIQNWEDMDAHFIIDFLKRKRERLI